MPALPRPLTPFHLLLPSPSSSLTSHSAPIKSRWLSSRFFSRYRSLLFRPLFIALSVTLSPSSHSLSLARSFSLFLRLVQRRFGNHNSGRDPTEQNSARDIGDPDNLSTYVGRAGGAHFMMKCDPFRDSIRPARLAGTREFWRDNLEGSEILPHTSSPKERKVNATKREKERHVPTTHHRPV